MDAMSESGDAYVDNLWKENLEDWVYEETKVVTYKWLSRQISVHVNVAKQMLFSFITNHKKEKRNCDLAVIYLLAGNLAKKPESIKICLVKSEDLQTKEAEFISITSKHIYAVSKLVTNLMKEVNVCQVHNIISTGLAYGADFSHLSSESRQCLQF